MAKKGSVRVDGKEIEFGTCENRSARPGWGWIRIDEGDYLALTHVPDEDEVKKKGTDLSRWNVQQVHRSDYNL